MIYEFGYGTGVQKVEISECKVLAELVSNTIVHEKCGVEAVKYAMEHPIGTTKLKEMVKPGQKVVIVTSDISRPMPSYQVIPAVLEELYEAGADKADICVVLALGSHRKHTEEEKKHIVGDKCYNEVEIVDSDIDDCVYLGKTSRGTPVEFHRKVVEADFRICLGNIEFHYFAGYSGGYKALMPGVSTVSAIQANHSMMISDDAFAGKLEGNPVREDIEEAGSILGVDYIVNVILDEHKHIVHAVAGDVIKAHREGCKYLDKMYRKPIPQRADIVIVSQGGAPKDANLYQTQKALDNAKHAVKNGGTIILVGACNEGLGSAKFEEWLTEAETPESMVSRVKKEFQLGGHKAAAIAMVLEYADIVLVSEMKEDFVKSIFLKPAHSAQEAFDQAIKKYGNEATVIAMPFGGSTLPVVEPDILGKA